MSHDREKLFSFLKKFQQDEHGPIPLQNNGNLTNRIPEQCDVHNQQFQSVFTPKSPLSLTRLSQMKFQDLVQVFIAGPRSLVDKRVDS